MNDRLLVTCWSLFLLEQEDLGNIKGLLDSCGITTPHCTSRTAHLQNQETSLAWSISHRAFAKDFSLRTLECPKIQ